MKNRIVRRFTFETNSSSCHSLSIAYRNSDDYVNDLIEKFKSGRTEIVVTLGHYYSGNQPLVSVEEKLSYIFTDFLEDYVNLLKNKSIKDPTHEDLIKFKHVNENFKSLVDLIEDSTNLPIVIKYNGDCYIDDHSKGEGSYVAYKSDSDIKQFLFDERNYVSLDYDG